MLGGAEQIDLREGLSRLRKLMLQLSAVGRKIMKPSKNQEAHEPGICEVYGTLFRNGIGLRRNPSGLS